MEEQFTEIIENIQADVHRETDRADTAEKLLAEARQIISDNELVREHIFLDGPLERPRPGVRVGGAETSTIVTQHLLRLYNNGPSWLDFEVDHLQRTRLALTWVIDTAAAAVELPDGFRRRRYAEDYPVIGFRLSPLCPSLPRNLMGKIEKDLREQVRLGPGYEEYLEATGYEEYLDEAGTEAKAGRHVLTRREWSQLEDILEEVAQLKSELKDYAFRSDSDDEPEPEPEV